MNVLNINTSIESYPFPRTNAALITAAVVAVTLTVIGTCALFPCVGTISGICTTYSGILLGGIAALVYQHLKMPVTRIHLQHASPSFPENFDATTIKSVLAELNLTGYGRIVITPHTLLTNGELRNFDSRISSYYEEGLLPPGRVHIHIERPEPIKTVSFRCVTPSLLTTVESDLWTQRTDCLKALIIRLGLARCATVSLTRYELIAENYALSSAETNLIAEWFNMGLDLPASVRINVNIEQPEVECAPPLPFSEEIWAKAAHRPIQLTSRYFYELSQSGVFFRHLSPRKEISLNDLRRILFQHGPKIKTLNLRNGLKLGQHDNFYTHRLIHLIPHLCPRLTSLDLSSARNNITLHIAPFLSALTTLMHLNLSHQTVQMPVENVRIRQTQLVHLDLERTEGVNERLLSYFPNLTYLNLARNKFYTHSHRGIARAIGALTRLVHLDLDRTIINGIEHELPRLSRLKHLNLTGHPLTPALVRALAFCPHLTFLSLRQPAAFTNDLNVLTALIPVLATLPKMETLDMKGIVLNETAMQALANRLKVISSLRSFDLTLGSAREDVLNNLASAICNQPTLKELGIHFRSPVQEPLLCVLPRLQQLKSLWISGTSPSQPTQLYTHYLQQLTSLTLLDLLNCSCTFPLQETLLPPNLRLLGLNLRSLPASLRGLEEVLLPLDPSISLYFKYTSFHAEALAQILAKFNGIRGLSLEGKFTGALARCLPGMLSIRRLVIIAPSGRDEEARALASALNLVNQLPVVEIQLSNQVHNQARRELISAVQNLSQLKTGKLYFGNHGYTFP